MNRSFSQHVRRTALILITGVSCTVLLLFLLHSVFSIPESSSQAMWLILLTTLLLCTLALFRITRFADHLSQVTQRMTQVAREIAKGDIDRKIDLAEVPITELHELGGAINDMATRARSDIADMKRLERVRSEFLGNVSHELRTPIFSVQGYLETLIDGAIEDRTVRDDFLQKTHQNVLRLHTLLADLIEISRIESGEMKMSFRYFNAVEYLKMIVDELQPTAEIAGVRLGLKVIGAESEKVSVMGDRDRLKQALVNLIENAIKYNRPDGSVTVEMEPRDHDVVVRVRDTGIGIPEEDIARIFERFYRVNKDRSRAVGGSGLGLAIVKHIVEAHGSTVLVESELGKGSVFSFTLKR